MADLQKSMQKMALVLERLVQKVEELDRKVGAIEAQVAKGSDTSKSEQIATNVSKSNNISAAAGSFLGSMAGAIAGVGLAQILFDDDIAPKDLAQKMGMDASVLTDFDERLEGIEEKIEDLDSELEELLAQTEAFDDGISDEEFEQMSLDDYLASEGEFEDFDDV